MHLTRVLSVLWKSKKRIPGRLHRGVNQAYVPIKTSWKKHAVKWMIMEQQNLDLINNPYVTQEEEATYGRDLGLKEIKQRKWFDKVTAMNKGPFKPDFTYRDHFEHLNVNKKWE